MFPDSSLTLASATTFGGGAHLIGANSPITFLGGGTVSGGTFGLNSNATLEVRSTVTVSGGAFSGSGTLKAISPGRLRLMHGTQIGIAVVNEGGIVELGPGPAHVMVESFGQNIFGTLEVVISGAPGSGNYDVLTVEETASLAGILTVSFNVPGALPGDTWQILTADNNIANGFNQFLVTGVPPGLKLIKFQTATGVPTTDTTFAAWAATKGLVPPDNDPGRRSRS